MPMNWDMRPDSIVRPPGLTLDVMDRADDLIIDWQESGEPMTWPLIVLLYEMMA
jgi:hypothetical protein